MSRPDDKSAQEAYYTTEGAHDPAVSSDHITVSLPISEPGSRLSETTSNDRKSFNVRIPSRILSLCGGGHLGILHLGVLKALGQRNLIKTIKGVVGISAGALVGLLHVLGYTLEEIEALLFEIDLTAFTSIESDSALFFYQTLCINSGDLLTAFITGLLEGKGYSATSTFADLPKYPFFRCYATRLQSTTIQEFSAEKTPKHPLLFAVRASMCLPVIFAPMKDPFTETLYYDAGLIHNMPFVFLTEEEKRQTLSVVFTMIQEEMKDEMTSVFTYAMKSFFIQRNQYYLRKYKMVEIHVDPVYFLSCSSKESKEELILQGYTACLRFLDAKPTTTLVRRYSVA